MDKKKVYLFIFSAILVFGLIILSAGMRQGWFSPRETFYIEFDTGEGVFVGTPVAMSGLKAGNVTQVDLNHDNKVIVQIKIQSKFADRVRADSKAVLGRPFIIGEKAISLTAGSRTEEVLKPNSTIPGEESLEITDMLSGGRMAPYFDTFNKLMKQLQLVIEGDGTPDSVTLVDVYKQAYVSLKSVETMGREIQLVRRDFTSSPDTQKILKDVALSSGYFKNFLEASTQTFPSLTTATTDFAKVMPQFAKALNETVFTMQAMQRSFILSGGVDRLKKELEDEKAKERAPASE